MDVNTAGPKRASPTNPSPAQQVTFDVPSIDKSQVKDEKPAADTADRSVDDQQTKRQQQFEAMEALKQMDLLPLVLNLMDRVVSGELAPKDIHNEVCSV